MSNTDIISHINQNSGDKNKHFRNRTFSTGLKQSTKHHISQLLLIITKASLLSIIAIVTTWIIIMLTFFLPGKMDAAMFVIEVNINTT